MGMTMFKNISKFSSVALLLSLISNLNFATATATATAPPSLMELEDVRKSNILILNEQKEKFVNLSIIQRWQRDENFLDRTHNAYALLDDGTVIKNNKGTVICDDPSSNLIHFSENQKANNRNFLQLLIDNKKSIKNLYFDMTLQESVNEIVSESSEATYHLINKNWHYSKPKEDLTTESELWTALYYKTFVRETNISEITQEKIANVPGIVINNDDLSSFGESLTDLINHSAQLECTIALTTVKITCLRQIMGDRFNDYVQYFQDITKKLGFKKEELFHELCLPLMTIKEGREAIPGTITYITNNPLYASFKPNGNGRGSNVVKVSNNKYLGFSDIYRSGPQPLESIEAQDFDLFCDESDVEYHKQDHSSFINECRKHQEKVNFYDYFDVAKITRFINEKKIEIAGNLYSL